jgi:hypothetical protein
MKPVYIETAGHTASTTLFQIFESLKNSYVTHATRDFDNKTPKNIFNDCEQSEEQFVLSMKAKRKSYKTVAAIHAQFALSPISLACKIHGIQYFFIIRNPIDQIDSCYNSYCNLILRDNDPTLLKRVMQIVPVSETINVRPTLSNVLFVLAVHYIITNNLLQLQHVNTKDKILKIETVLKSKKSFVASLNLPELSNEPINYFDKNKFVTNRHTLDAQDLKIPKAEKREILEKYAFQDSLYGGVINFEKLVLLSGYNLEDNLSSKRLD